MGYDVNLALGLAGLMKLEAMLAATLLRPNCVQEKEFSRPAFPDGDHVAVHWCLYRTK